MKIQLEKKYIIMWSNAHDLNIQTNNTFNIFEHTTTSLFCKCNRLIIFINRNIKKIIIWMYSYSFFEFSAMAVMTIYLN